jgi:hypothetical protein
MKVIVRSLVVALAVSGAIATTFVSSTPAKATVTTAKTSAMPVPRCDPNGTSDCGMGNW